MNAARARRAQFQTVEGLWVGLTGSPRGPPCSPRPREGLIAFLTEQTSDASCDVAPSNQKAKKGVRTAVLATRFK
jgi:hypothetical protein